MTDINLIEISLYSDFLCNFAICDGEITPSRHKKD